MKRTLFSLSLFAPLLMVELQAQSPLTEDEQTEAEIALIDGQRYLMIENHARALEMFKKAADINPYSGAIYYKIAEIYLLNEALDEALLHINRAIELDGNNKYFYQLAANIHMARSDLLAAQKVYETLIKKGDNSQEVYAELASIYLHQGKADDALRSLTKMQELYGTNEAIVEKKQQIFLSQGKVDEMLNEWRNLVSQYPSEARFSGRFLELLLDFNKLDEADSLIQHTNTNGHEKNDFLLNLALVQLKNDQPVEALTTVESFFTSRQVSFEKKGWFLQKFAEQADGQWPPSLPGLLHEVGKMHAQTFQAQALIGDLFVQMNKPEQALAYYKMAQKLEGSQFSVWENILQIQLLSQRYDSLVTWGELALEYYPNQSSIYYFLGSAYLGLEKTSQAKNFLQIGKRYQTNPDKLGLFDVQLGWAAFLEGERAEAGALFEKALKNVKTRELALDRWSDALIGDNSNLKKADRMVDELLNIRPDHPPYLEKKARITFMSGQLEVARDWFEQALAQRESGPLMEEYGDVLFKLGEKNKALTYWRKAAQLPGASEKLMEKISENSL